MTIDPKNPVRKSEIQKYLKSNIFKNEAELMRKNQRIAIENIKNTISQERKNNESDFIDRYTWTQLRNEIS